MTATESKLQRAERAAEQLHKMLNEERAFSAAVENAVIAILQRSNVRHELDRMIDDRLFEREAD